MRLSVVESKPREAKRPGRVKIEVERRKEGNIQEPSQREERQNQHVDVDGMEDEGVSVPPHWYTEAGRTTLGVRLPSLAWRSDNFITKLVFPSSCRNNTRVLHPLSLEIA